MPKPKCQGSLRSAFLDSCYLKLKTWIYDLPPELRLDRLDANSLPQAFTLHMVYSTACILLARPYLAPAASINNGGMNSTNSVDEKFEGDFKKADVLLQTSAKQICSTARKYRRVFGSFRRSPITATHCTLSAALVFLRSAKTRAVLDTSGEPSSSFNTDDIRLCLDVLDELSTSWDTARRIRLNLLKLIKKSRTTDTDAGQELSLSLEDYKTYGERSLGKDPDNLQAAGSTSSQYQPWGNPPQGDEDQQSQSMLDAVPASLGFGLEHTLETMIGDEFAFGTDIMNDDFAWDEFWQQ